MKSKLEGEIEGSASSVSQKIQEIGLQACQQIEQQVTAIRKQFSDLFSDALNTGEIVGQMSEAVKRGERVQKSMDVLIGEAKGRMEAR